MVTNLARKVQPSPSMLKREAAKNLKYSRLITVAQKQTKEKKRLQCPTFTSFIVSDLSPAAVELQEWIVTAFAKKCEREGSRADGCNSADLIRTFRQKFKLNVQLSRFGSGWDARLASRSGTMCSNWFMCGVRVCT